MGEEWTIVTTIKTPPVDQREEYPDSATNVNLPCYPKRVIAATINMLDGFSTYVPVGITWDCQGSSLST